MSEHAIFYTALLAFIALPAWVATRTLHGAWQRYNERIGIRQVPRLSASTVRILGKARDAKRAAVKSYTKRNPLDSLPLERKP